MLPPNTGSGGPNLDQNPPESQLPDEPESVELDEEEDPDEPQSEEEDPYDDDV